MQLAEDLWAFPWDGKGNNSNSYAIRYWVDGLPRYVLIDPGRVTVQPKPAVGGGEERREPALRLLTAKMKADGITPAEVGLVLATHVHADHCGSAREFRRMGARVAIHEDDALRYPVEVARDHEPGEPLAEDIGPDILLAGGKVELGSPVPVTLEGDTYPRTPTRRNMHMVGREEGSFHRRHAFLPQGGQDGHIRRGPGSHTDEHNVPGDDQGRLLACRTRETGVHRGRQRGRQQLRIRHQESGSFRGARRRPEDRAGTALMTSLAGDGCCGARNRDESDRRLRRRQLERSRPRGYTVRPTSHPECTASYIVLQLTQSPTRCTP